MGRQRRWSNSTVATVDEERIRYRNETTVLKTTSPEDDDWHTSFVLEDVAVFNKKGELGNLLSVAFDGPFTVRGRIQVEEDQKDRFLKRNLKSAYISIEGCTRYSVGVGGEDSRSPCIWAGGQCGWFEIRPPTPEYSQIYNKMAQAVSLYYTLQDVHGNYEKEQTRGRPKKGPKKAKRDNILASLDIDTTFLKYAVLVGDGSVLEEVIAACDEHAPFLISQFSQDEALPAGHEEKFDWRPTTFYKWLVSRHPDVVAKVTNLGAGKATPTTQPLATETPTLLDVPPLKTALPKPAVASKPRKQKKLAHNPVTSSRQSTSSRRSNSSPEIVETNSQDFATKSRSRSLRSSDEVKEQLLTTAHATADVEASTMDIDSVEPAASVEATPLNHDLEMQDVEQGTPAQALFVTVEELAREAEKPLTWSYIKSNIYYRHKIKRYDIAGEILEYYSAELLPMLDKARWSETGFFRELQTKAQGPRKEPENFTLADIAHSLQRRTKAEPRNPPSKPGPARKNVMEVETPQPRKRGRPAGKMSSLRPSSKKRVMDDSGEGVRGFKFAKLSHFADQDIGEDDSDVLEDSLDEEDEQAAAVDTPVPIKVVLEAEKLPDLTAKGPNGTWVCDQDNDCAFVERNPDDADGKARIERHIEEEHQDESQVERINLAFLEGGRGHLPIDHLLEKIRRMGAKVDRDEEVEVNNETLSKPVKRRLLV